MGPWVAGCQALVMSGLLTPTGLALDVASGKMYFTDKSNGVV